MNIDKKIEEFDFCFNHTLYCLEELSTDNKGVLDEKTCRCGLAGVKTYFKQSIQQTRNEALEEVKELIERKADKELCEHDRFLNCEVCKTTNVDEFLDDLLQAINKIKI